MGRRLLGGSDQHPVKGLGKMLMNRVNVAKVAEGTWGSWQRWQCGQQGTWQEPILWNTVCEQGRRRTEALCMMDLMFLKVLQLREVGL